MRFLVVDDSAMDRLLLTSILQDLGHEVDVCTSAKGAVAKLAKEKYSAIFLDIVMPEQDGYKFLRMLRSNEETAKQHVIFCSSKKTGIEIDYGINRAGANDYLTKPVNREIVVKTLERIPQ
jgi:PleD family two-component response regulator